ncbi:MAG: hypothetical protein AAGA18_11055 [Verrucomicrobiota bacterium]
MENARKLPPLAQLVQIFREKKIRFQIAGMSAAVLQGVPATTLDTNIWIDLPKRQYLKLYMLCKELGRKPLAKTVVALSDDSLVNFLFHIDGLNSFATEFKRAQKVKWQDMFIPVVPLERILKSKKHIQRPKDIADIPLIEQTIKLKKKS